MQCQLRNGNDEYNGSKKQICDGEYSKAHKHLHRRINAQMRLLDYQARMKYSKRELQ